MRAPGQVLRPRVADGRPRLAVVTGLAVLASAMCMQPLLDGGWWLLRSAAMVATVVGVGVLARALRAPAPLQPLAQAAGLVVALTAAFAPGQAVLGFLPGPAAIGQLRTLVAQGRDYAMATTAPAGPDEGLLLLIAGGVGLAALVADSLASGLDLPGLTLLPLATLFVVPWSITDGEVPGWAFVAVALAWLAVLAANQRERAAAWSPGARPGSPAVGLTIAAATTSLALLGGFLVELRGPGGSIDIGAGVGSGTVRVDAMVSLRRSLVSNDNRVVVEYATTAQRPDYLRLAVLDRFDGEEWTPSGATVLRDEAPQPLGGSQGGADDVVEYRLDVGPLGGATLPSPPGTFVSLNDFPVVWDARTSLPLRSDGRAISGSRVGLLALPPTTEAARLRAASLSAIDAPRRRVDTAADPEPLTGPLLPRLAREVTADAQTPFDRALALQRWFTTSGGFTYSTSVVTGSSQDALATFLDERVGYCEQFAATMALMARAVGIDARVVVGFTQGAPAGNRWVVRGTDAHAWPELWMGSAGWVRFEPTPGAPTVTTPGYAAPAVVPGQDPTAPGSTASAAPTASPGTPAQVPDADSDVLIPDSQRRGVPLREILAVLLLVALAAPMAVRMAQRRRRLVEGGAESSYREVVATWADLRGAPEAMTPRATIGLLSAQLGDDEVARAAAQRILATVEAARYGGADQPGARVLSVATAGRVRDGGGGPVTAGVAGGTSGVGGARGAGGTGFRGTRAGGTSPAADARLVVAGLRRATSRGARLRATVLPRSLLPRR